MAWLLDFLTLSHVRPMALSSCRALLGMSDTALPCADFPRRHDAKKARKYGVALVLICRFPSALRFMLIWLRFFCRTSPTSRLAFTRSLLIMTGRSLHFFIGHGFSSRICPKFIDAATAAQERKF